jgi:dTDP-4-dehydrorhamnose reductase
MKVLLTGKNGQVGFELQRSLAPVCELHAVGSKDCDLTDEAALRNLIETVQPQLIVNTAAYTAVDRAETEPEQAFALNAKALEVMGESAKRLGASVLHFSTDYVFDGEKDGAYCETDATNPQSAYGRSKLAGEIALAQATPHHVILRTSWVMGAHGGNFAKSILKKARDTEELRVVVDQLGAPTTAALLADVTAHLVKQLQREGTECFPFGTYHVTGSGSTHWNALAKFVIQFALDSGMPLKARPETVQAILASDFGAAARRPANSRLNTTKFQETFGLRLPEWQKSVSHLLQQIISRS